MDRSSPLHLLPIPRVQDEENLQTSSGFPGKQRFLFLKKIEVTWIDFTVSFGSNLQREEYFVFDAQTIRRMELLVLEALDWRMRSITPFSFLRFFTSFFSPAQPPLLQALQAHATEILLKTQNGNPINRSN